MAWKTSSRKGTHWQTYGPLYLVCISVPLVMADLTRHVLQGDPFPQPLLAQSFSYSYLLSVWASADPFSEYLKKSWEACMILLLCFDFRTPGFKTMAGGL